MTVDEDRLRRTLRVYEERAPVADDYAGDAIARARSNRRKRVATVCGVLSAVLLVGLGWALEQGSGPTDVASEPPGKVIGDELGLEPVAWPPPEACTYFAAYSPTDGYCLDGYSGDTTELVILTQRINGWEMTEDRERFIRASIKLTAMGEGDQPIDPAEEVRLKQILDESKSGRGVLNEPKDLADYEGLTGKELGDALGLVPMTYDLPIILCDYGIDMGEVNGEEWGYCIEGLGDGYVDMSYFATALSGNDVRMGIVPDVVGLTQDEAVARLEAGGFAVEVTRVYSDEPEGQMVLSQEPRPGSRQLLRSGVEIILSKGEEPPQPPGPTGVVPDVVGMTRSDADEVMRDAGFRVSVFSFIPSDQLAGTVLSQDPAAGEEFPLGDGIRLRVAD